MIYLTIFFLISILIFAYAKYKYILCPAVVHNAMWIVSLVWLSFIEERKYLTAPACALIVVGAICFQIGHSAHVTIGKRKNQYLDEYLLVVNKRNVYILVIICLVLFGINYSKYFASIISSRGLYWYNALAGIKSDVGVVDSDYIGSAIQYIFIALLILYWNMDSKNRRKIQIPMSVMLLMNICIVVFVATRNRMLFFVLPMVVAFLLCHEKNNRIIVRYMLILVVAFIMYFIAVGMGKYYYNYTNGFDFDIFLVEFASYLCTGVINLGYAIEHFSATLWGTNTISFFIAVYGKLTGSAYTIVSTVTDELLTFGRFSSNVFTIYDFYLRDFGVLYALIIQFVLGIVHGNLYYRLNSKSLLNKYFFCMLTYPLVMQFFLDQYLSLTSLWVQVTLAGMFIYKSGLFFHYESISQ